MGMLRPSAKVVTFTGAAGDGIEIGEDADGVGAVLGGLGAGRRRRGTRCHFAPVFVEGGDGLAEGVAAGGPGVERGSSDPDAAGGVEGDVERFLDLGLVGDEVRISKPGGRWKRALDCAAVRRGAERVPRRSAARVGVGARERAK